jgi:hypothetical protein
MPLSLSGVLPNALIFIEEETEITSILKQMGTLHVVCLSGANHGALLAS